MDRARPTVPGPESHDALAAVVLGSDRPRALRREWADADHDEASREDSSVGYDARSVLVLALVVAMLAAIAGWSMTMVRGDDGAGPRAAASGASGGASSNAAAVAAPDREAAPAVEAATFDVGLGRVALGRSTYGAGTVRVAVANRGSTPLTARRPTQVRLLVGGELVGSQDLAPLRAGQRRIVEFDLGRCPSGAQSVIALLDSSAGAPDAQAANDVARRTGSFPC